jgi:hypothetical protein
VDKPNEHSTINKSNDPVLMAFPTCPEGIPPCPQGRIYSSHCDDCYQSPDQ